MSSEGNRIAKSDVQGEMISPNKAKRPNWISLRRTKSVQIHDTDVTCEDINDEMLDEAVAGQASDPRLIVHFGTCVGCAERLVEYEARIAALRHGLRVFRTPL